MRQAYATWSLAPPRHSDRLPGMGNFGAASGWGRVVAASLVAGYLPS